MIGKYLIVLQEKGFGEEIKNSLLFLTRLLGQYYGKRILLIDEYDVPLAKAVVIRI